MKPLLIKNLTIFTSILSQAHVSNSSRIPDHCSQFALSDPSNKCFQIKCDHKHDLYCGQCEEIKSTLSDIKTAISSTSFESQGEKDEIVYTFNQALLAIEIWKAHQLRVVVQDTARTDILDILDEGKVILIQDWAMKFLPRRYRESQGDWFAKRGISWHVTVAIRKRESALETQAFVHIIEKCKQDSPCVVILMEHVLETLKKENPEIKSVFYRQDNAGCYHSANTIYACKTISDSTGIFIKRIDFSDPQGGKGPCDRFAATMKCHVRAWLNEGHDVSNAEEFQEALLSHGGVPGTRICLLEDLNYPECLSDKWPGISKINNFEFDEDGIKVWKAYKVGNGKEVSFCDNSAGM